VAVEAALEVWSEPLGHAAILRGLWRAAGAERLPHALLLQGPAGIGKYLAARWLALGLLCARPGADGAPCASCGACKRAMGGSHGDLLFVEVEQEHPDVRSEQLRLARFIRRDEPFWSGPTVEDFLGHRALEGGWRVVIVRESERANDEAQNAMLKMLEEPPARVLWLLETSQPEALLATIKSRCVRVDFTRLSDADVERALAAQLPASERNTVLARWSRGSPGRALALAQCGGWELRALLVEVLAGRTPALAATRALWELDGEFTGKTPKAIERQRARFALDLWLEVLRDLAALSAGAAPQGLAHGDLGAGLEPATIARAARTIPALLALRLDLDANIDPPATLDRAALALASGPRASQSLG
jgi:DNA polymerase-3 subunit delta'